MRDRGEGPPRRWNERRAGGRHAGEGRVIDRHAMSMSRRTPPEPPLKLSLSVMIGFGSRPDGGRSPAAAGS